MNFLTKQTKLDQKIQLSPQELSSLTVLVDKTLEQGFPLLRFPGQLERIFDHEIEPQRRQRLWIDLVVAIILYDIFLYTDYRILSDVFQTALIVRIGILTPIMMLFGYLIYRGLPAIPREIGIVLLMVMVGGTLLYLMNISTNPNKIAYFPGFLLIITFCNVVILLRFWYSLAASAIFFIIYVLFYPHLSTLPNEVVFANIFLLFTCVVMTLYANYFLESETRRGYLLFLSDRIRKGELKSQNVKLKELTFVDPLTNLANRREVEDYIYHVCEEVRPASIAIIMFDVDNFKEYNDHYGHQEGDICLQRIASIMRQSVVRKNDIVGRYGGEEFIVLLPETSETDAVFLAEQIRKNVENCSIPHIDSSASNFVTVSGGVAAGEFSTCDDIHMIQSTADAALYLAKQSGRNVIKFLNRLENE
jgi:diguanylate cyclase (GGDEF)-like protein